MKIQTFLLSYSLFSTIILIFLFKQRGRYKKWYLILLIGSNTDFRVDRFFKEMESQFNHFYYGLKQLIAKVGRPLTDPRFQFRFLIWWKFFGPKQLATAIRKLNNSPDLKTILKAPINEYTSKKFHYFRKKLGACRLEKMQEILIQNFQFQGFLKWKTIIVDSFPVKSFLNTQKCLRRPKIDILLVKAFVEKVDVAKILKRLKTSPKMISKIETKLKVLLVKEIWDVVSWNKCWKMLFEKKPQKDNFTFLFHYKSSQSLRKFEIDLRKQSHWPSIEKLLVDAAAQTLKELGVKAKVRRFKFLTDLNATFYLPHRWKDDGISLHHCSSKNIYQYGRGGLIAIIQSLEIPLCISLTPKYKQSKREILIFFQKLFFKFSCFFGDIKILGDSEFGFLGLKNLITTLFNGTPIFPNYGASNEKIKISTEDKNTRKMVERVIARLVVNWDLETPQHLGIEYAEFHLQLAVLCDLLQVTFNFKLGNYGHPHALESFKG